MRVAQPFALRPEALKQEPKRSPNTPHDTGGIGLGLYIAKAIVTLHGGDMRAENEEGKGSTFRFTLPGR